MGSVQPALCHDKAVRASRHLHQGLPAVGAATMLDMTLLSFPYIRVALCFPCVISDSWKVETGNNWAALLPKRCRFIPYSFFPFR